MAQRLVLDNIHASTGDKKILNGVSFSLEKGEVCVLMGPNGAGKSTVSHVLMGNPKYSLDSGKIYLDEEDITESETHERAQKGLFMAFQYPVEIPGVTMTNFLRTSYNSLKGTSLKVGEFRDLLNEKMSILGMDSRFRTRFVNSGFSGGEKKRSEILQMLLYEPEFGILDEIDSGLDVDGLKQVATALERLKKEHHMGMLIITHYNKILQHIKPDKVFILKDGQVVKSGGHELADEVEAKGFKQEEIATEKTG